MMLILCLGSLTWMLSLLNGVRETRQNSSRLLSLPKQVTAYAKPVVSIKVVCIRC